MTTAVENDYTTGGTNKSISLTPTTGNSNTYTLKGQVAKAGSNTIVPTSTTTSLSSSATIGALGKLFETGVSADTTTTGNTDLSFTIYYTKTTWSLPYTGGIGILLIVILGVGISSLAIILRKRKNRQAEEIQS
ncbi:LPXTG cell wall anchor domain-containing protein [Lactococcus protaetiae]|uniref:LPXTG cell wall anchor domain-containing protein n=1 Tax=Lactococcus protaetiae TaxID=2592653 RepID=UPI001680419B|nr:LPXTG cell wall anchor domain-containing protein [Lactococcus protaetiae]